MERAALYIRVSTDDQREYSPDAQRKIMLEYAKQNNYIVDEQHIFIDEGISGKKTDKRLGFLKMISMAKTKPKPFDAIIIHKTDRFARNREDSVVYKMLLRKELGIKVLSATEPLNQDDKFSIILEAMLEAMAEYYSLNLADEVKKGMVEKAGRGEHSGPAPLGYKLVNKRLAINEDYSSIVFTIFDNFANKGMSILEIARDLNAKNIRTQNGAKFNKRSLRYIINNPCYYGAHRYNYRKSGENIPQDSSEWIITENAHEAIVEKMVWEKAQKIMQINKNLAADKRKEPRRYWMTGLAKCSQCGSSLTTTLSQGKYPTYYCTGYKAGTCMCKNSISYRKLEKLLFEAIRSDLDSSEINIIKIKNNNMLTEKELLESELSKTRKKYDLASKAFLSEIDTIEEYKRKKTLIQSEEQEILSKLEKYNDNNAETVPVSDFKNHLKMLESDSLSEVEKAKIARSFIYQFDLDKEKKIINITYFFTGL